MYTRVSLYNLLSLILNHANVKEYLKSTDKFFCKFLFTHATQSAKVDPESSVRISALQLISVLIDIGIKDVDHEELK